MNKLLTGAAALAVAATVAPAFAQVPQPPGVAQGTAPAAPVPPPHAIPPLPEMRSHMMVMGDHVMTRDEAVQHVRKMFAKLDTNRDGVVTREEVDALHAKMMSAVAMAGDMPRRLEEHGIMMGDRGQIFDRLDTNHDGSISRQEFMAGQPLVREQRVMILRDGSKGDAGMPAMDRMHEHMRAEGMGRGLNHLFEMADRNHDGRVTLAEAEAAALAHFDNADRNHDGKITPDEHQQMRQVIRMEHPRS